MHADTLRIATLNVFYLSHPEDIAEALRAHLPLDVLALQEVSSREKLRTLAALLETSRRPSRSRRRCR